MLETHKCLLCFLINSSARTPLAHGKSCAKLRIYSVFKSCRAFAALSVTANTSHSNLAGCADAARQLTVPAICSLEQTTSCKRVLILLFVYRMLCSMAHIYLNIVFFVYGILYIMTYI